MLRLALFALLSVAYAKVDFTSSTLYDIYDFEGVAEVPLPRCNSGCLVFASTPSEGEADPFASQLFVRDNARGTTQSIAELAKKVVAATSQKVPLDLPAGSYTILNRNGANAKAAADVTVWVIESSKVRSSDYEIYDAGSMKRAAKSPAAVVTILSAAPFVVYAQPGESNSYTARLTGFDNALDNNADGCKYAFKTVPTFNFEGFRLQVNSPIISLVFAKKTALQLKVDFEYYNVLNMANSGFVASKGYHGCSRVQQVYHPKNFNDGDEYDMHGEPNSFKLDIETDSKLSAGIQIRIKDMTNSKTTPITSTSPANFQMTIPSTQFVLLRFEGIAPPDQFILRYTSTKR